MMKYKDIKSLITCSYIITAKRTNPFTNKKKEYEIRNEENPEEMEILDNSKVLAIKQFGYGYKKTITAVLLDIPEKYIEKPVMKYEKSLSLLLGGSN